MKKLHILFAALCLILAGACSSDDILEQTPDTPQAKGQRITIRATVDEAMTVKAGVVENNTNYAQGETFYWNNSDQIKLIFVKVNKNDIDNEEALFDEKKPIPISVFTAENANRSGSADFTGYIPNDLADGTYNIYACSSEMEQDFYNDQYGYRYNSFFFSSLQKNQTQIGKSSKQLYADGNMDLWGTVRTGMEIVNGKLKEEAPALSCEMAQLNAMLRFTITNNIVDRAMTVKKIEIHTKNGDSDIYTFLNYPPYLDLFWDNNEWTGCWLRTSTMSLTVEQEEGEATISNGGIFDAYMCVPALSEELLANDDMFLVKVYLQGADGKIYMRRGEIKKEHSAFNFLYNGGLQAGARYYFQIGLNEQNTTLFEDYMVGDLYPKTGTPEGIVCEVDEAGKAGKILSLDESSEIWGAFEITETLSWDEGEDNTSKIKTLSIDSYPAFKWCVNKGGDDWYLPGVNEMEVLLDVKRVLNSRLEAEQYTVLSGDYWTSTTSDFDVDLDDYVEKEDQAWIFSFSNGRCALLPRSTSLPVRAMKKFDTTNP